MLEREQHVEHEGGSSSTIMARISRTSVGTAIGSSACRAASRPAARSSDHLVDALPVRALTLSRKPAADAHGCARAQFGADFDLGPHETLPGHGMPPQIAPPAPAGIERGPPGPARPPARRGAAAAQPDKWSVPASVELPIPASRHFANRLRALQDTAPASRASFSIGQPAAEQGVG